MTRNARRSAIVLRFILLGVLTSSGCATLSGGGQPLVPTRHQTRTGPYTVFTNFPLSTDAPALRHLAALDRQVAATLHIRADPEGTPIEVYILNDREAFTHFLTYYYPEFPPRRAFFLAQGDRRVVYTFLGNRLAEDLRHEATHALLNATIGDVPLWLDEGLAEYFEGQDGSLGRNAEHLGRLPQDLADGWTPNLRRLEGLNDVREMTPRDYRESWAWVHYLLNGTPPDRDALLSYLTELRTSPSPLPLSDRLAATTGPELTPRLLAHIEQVRTHPIASAPPSREPTIRLQSAPTEVITRPASAPPRRRGFFSRLADAFRF